ncbi:FecR family protein [Desertivirga brevis]|uniref:FecR family protein n=1 Tax=Desertivirga brevis TaxID=2810310 RepID=UPI001A970064|nr:FecR domain-containing protein [Pedobacter sp. SYSU D00873]
MQNNFNEYAFTLIVDEFDGNISEDQKMELQAWRQLSAENEKIYQEFHSIKSEIDALAAFKEIDVNASWSKVNEGLDARVFNLRGSSSERKARATGSSTKKSYKWLYGLAASVIFVIGLLMFRSGGLDRLETGAGEHKRVTLPDGSWLALAEGTVIQYDSLGFNNKRELIFVKGEAFFRVIHNHEKPFLIKTDEATIQDLGTDFFVTKNKESVKVMVSSGTVALKALATGESRIISAGHSGLYSSNDKSLTEKPDTGAHEVQRLNKQLTFVNADLMEIVNKLKSVYGKNIVIKDRSLMHRKLTAPLSYQTVDSALSVIAASLQVKVARSGSGFVIMK